MSSAYIPKRGMSDPAKITEEWIRSQAAAEYRITVYPPATARGSILHPVRRYRAAGCAEGPLGLQRGLDWFTLWSPNPDLIDRFDVMYRSLGCETIGV